MPNNPYLVNRTQRDLQNLESLLNIQDYLETRKEKKRVKQEREQFKGSLDPKIRSILELTEAGVPSTAMKSIMPLLGFEEDESPERLKYLQGLTPEELPFATTAEEAGGSGFTPEGAFAPEQSQGAFSTPERMSVVPKLGIATMPKEEKATGLTDMKTAVASYLQEHPKATKTQAIEWYKRLAGTQDILDELMQELRGENAKGFTLPPGWDELTPAEQAEYKRLKGIK